MKKTLLMITLMMSLCFNSFSQFHIDSFYVNKTEFLMYSVVQEFDSLSQDQLNIKIKNWAGTNFTNMKEVLVSETKEQLVFNYITESFYIKTLGMATYKNWYIRMVVQIKDNKIKISIYDDGNCFWPGSYSGGVSVPSVSARTYKFQDYFGKKGTCMKMYNDGLENVHNSCIKFSNNLINTIKNQTKVQSDF